MKLTKFAHSCVLVEDGNRAILFDPGIFSWQSGTVDVTSFPRLDAIIVSHKHPDHCAEPFVRALVDKYPDVQWYAPHDAHDDLQSWGVRYVTNQSQDDVYITEQNHAPVEPFGTQVHNLVSHWNKVTHPGDTHDFTESKEVLFLPIQAPWGTTIRAIQLAEELKPKFVLPIHDWMWRDEWREGSYDRLGPVFEQMGITFLRPVDGQAIEVNA